MRTPRHLTAAVAMLVAIPLATTAMAAPAPDTGSCDPAPGGSYWTADVRELPTHSRSSTWVAAIGSDAPVHPDFGAGTWNGGPIGIPYITVAADQPRVDVAFGYADESDPGPYPIPENAPIEGGPGADGDRHVLVLDRDACTLYELFDAHPRSDGGWDAGSGAVFDLSSQALRPDGWTSADAAGLPILPGLVRYDEVAAGEVAHAIRVTVPRSQAAHLWPARHHAGSDDPGLPPMGARLRLSGHVDPAAFPPQARTIVTAMQRYGVIVADNGSPWFISGVPDERWDNDDLRALRGLSGADFEVIDASSLMADPDSGWVAGAGAVEATRIHGDDRIATAIALSRDAFAAGAPTAVLARADAFPDALAAGPVAVASAGPLLLTGSDALADAVADELRRLEVGEVVLAGGTSAVSMRVERDVRALGVEVLRVGGRDRFETAAGLSGTAAARWNEPDQGAVLALGAHAIEDRAWPDALAALPYAARTRRPVLLATTDALPTATSAALTDLRITHVTIVGGTAAISTTVERELERRDIDVTRIGGDDRYDTAARLAAAAVALGASPDAVLVATGAAFADSLGAGAAIAARGGVLLLTQRGAVPAPTAARVRTWEPTWLRVAGGPAAVADGTVRHLVSLRDGAG